MFLLKRFYLFIYLFIHCPYYAWEEKGRFMKNPGIIALASMIDASQFFPERLYAWRNCAQRKGMAWIPSLFARL